VRTGLSKQSLRTDESRHNEETWFT